MKFHQDENESKIKYITSSNYDILGHIRASLNWEALSGDSIEKLTLVIECEKKQKNRKTVMKLYKNRIKRLQLLK